MLSDKLDVLLERYEGLKAENKRLKTDMAAQLASIEKLNRKLAATEEKLMAVQMGNAVQGEPEKQALRRQLDTVIGEIDKILHTLND